MLDIYDIENDSSNFPINLLSAGYGTALLGALLLYHFDGGVLNSGLIFWLGGVVAVFFWGGLWVHINKSYSRAFPLSH